MRKSTVVAMAILVFAFMAMVWLFDAYTKPFVEEIRRAKVLTDDLRASLAPDTKIKLARVAGASKYVVADPVLFGLLVDVKPAREVFSATDPHGVGLARTIAERAFPLYGEDRPLDWVEVRVEKPDGSKVKPMGFLRAEGGGVEPIRGTVPAVLDARPPGTTPKDPPGMAPSPPPPPPPEPPSPPPAPPATPPTVPPGTPPTPSPGTEPTPVPVPGMEADGGGGMG